MGNYSKAIGALVGGVIGLLGGIFALPAEWQTPEVIGAITTVLSLIATYVFPANKAPDA